MKAWHFTGKRSLGLRDRLRVLFGVPIYVRFATPDGACHAACQIDVIVQHEWPDDSWVLIENGWPPLASSLPPPPPAPHPALNPNTRVRM